MIKLLVDVSLSPTWVDVFTKHGYSAVHWSAVGDPRAADRILMAWARENGYAVFTHDLDFGVRGMDTGRQSSRQLERREHSTQ